MTFGFTIGHFLYWIMLVECFICNRNIVFSTESKDGRKVEPSLYRWEESIHTTLKCLVYSPSWGLWWCASTQAQPKKKKDTCVCGSKTCFDWHIDTFYTTRIWIASSCMYTVCLLPCRWWIWILDVLPSKYIYIYTLVFVLSLYISICNSRFFKIWMSNPTPPLLAIQASFLDSWHCDSSSEPQKRALSFRVMSKWLWCRVLTHEFFGVRACFVEGGVEDGEDGKNLDW